MKKYQILRLLMKSSYNKPAVIVSAHTVYMQMYSIVIKCSENVHCVPMGMDFWSHKYIDDCEASSFPRFKVATA